MVAPWRLFGLSLLLACAAACTSPEPTPAPTSSRPTPTELGQAATRPPASATAPAPTQTQDPTATPTQPAPLTEVTPGPTPGEGTAAATLPPEGSPAAGIVTPTPTGGPCTNDVEYIADLSVPDGTAFEPGEPLVKQWSVQNAGTCNWEAGYRLVLVSGNALGARSEQALYPARAGLEAVIEVAMIAPAEPGSYTGRWQARDPAGNVFGDRIFITIQVVAPVTPTETTTPTP